MHYVSTRGQAPTLDFSAALLAGLAQDGGLYLPETWPHLTHTDQRNLRTLSYPDLAAHIIAPFAAPAIGLETLQTLCREAYAGFTHPAIVPLIQIGPNLWVQELFHGPTLAFKDLAMQLLARLFDHVLTQTGGRITILGATSGDTGSAAIEACRDRDRVDIAILHPKGRTSEVQRRQMTTVAAANVRNIAVDGNFDDCQDLVKAAFADAPFRDSLHLSAVNSINWARIAAQIAYYVHAALALGAPDREISVAVPTGNFGNILAAWAAQRMGVPIRRLIMASNHNDILTRFVADNDMSIRPIAASLSPSMDIGVSSNFERLLFELLERNAPRTAGIMTGFRHTGRMDVPPDAWVAARATLSAHRLDDAGTLAEIRRTWQETGYLADPHTATAIAAARRHAADTPADDGIPIVVAGTAHPAKFPDAMHAAIGTRPPLPPHLADLYDRPEIFTEAENDLAAIQAQLRAFVSRNAA